MQLSKKDIISIMKLAKSQNVKKITFGDLTIEYNISPEVSQEESEQARLNREYMQLNNIPAAMPDPKRSDEIDSEAKKQLEEIQQELDDEYLDLNDFESYEDQIVNKEVVQEEAIT